MKEVEGFSVQLVLSHRATAAKASCGKFGFLVLAVAAFLSTFVLLFILHPTVSSAFLPLAVPHPAAPSFLTCSLLCSSQSQTVQESLSHDCHMFSTDSFPLLLPGKHLLVAWHLFTPLLIYKPKYIHSNASTGLILSKTHSSFNVQLK